MAVIDTFSVDHLYLDTSDYTDNQKVNVLKDYFNNIMEMFTDEDGNIYWSVHDIVLDRRDVRTLSLYTLDNSIAHYAIGESLDTYLNTFVKYAEYTLNAKSVEYNKAYGLVVIKIEFENAEFKRCFYVEEDA